MSTFPGPAAATSRPRRIGCVSYINSKPLIDGLEGRADPAVRFDVPSRLLDDLQSGEVDIALCPVIDYFRSTQPLEIVPVGGIGCRGPTLTVRLFSRVPLDRITTIYADVDSHTSVALVRVLLAKRLNLRPAVVPFDAREDFRGSADEPATLLLIGDKVVTSSPPQERYPHQIDLGESWFALTGLPFVFAVWMARPGSDLGALPALLQAQRLANADRIPEIAARYAGPHGWPEALARDYLGRLLRYAIGPDELTAMQRFGELAQEYGLIDSATPLRIRKISVPPAEPSTR